MGYLRPCLKRVEKWESNCRFKALFNVPREIKKKKILLKWKSVSSNNNLVYKYTRSKLQVIRFRGPERGLL